MGIGSSQVLDPKLYIKSEDEEISKVVTTTELDNALIPYQLVSDLDFSKYTPTSILNEKYATMDYVKTKIAKRNPDVRVDIGNNGTLSGQLLCSGKFHGSNPPDNEIGVCLGGYSTGGPNGNTPIDCGRTFAHYPGYGISSDTNPVKYIYYCLAPFQT